MAKTLGLGRGLGALIPQTKQQKWQADDLAKSAIVFKPAEGSVHELPTDKIVADPKQPRKHFDHGALEELVESIQKHGILQPLIVMPADNNGIHMLIAGERRLRAAKMVGLVKVPVIIRAAHDQERLELSIIENVQRHNLNPIEEAVAYQRLIDEFNLTQDEVGKQVGKRRPTIANSIRLLELPSEVQQAVSEGKISTGHAKILAGLETEREKQAYLEQIIQKNLSVRDLELVTKQKRQRKPVAGAQFDPVREAQEEMLRERFGTKVEIKKIGPKGQIVLHFYSIEELQRLLNQLG